MSPTTIKTLLSNPRNCTEADLIIARILQRNRTFVLAHPETKLSLWQTIKFYYYNYRLKKGYPWAYITGHKEFFGLDFLVNKHTLIPRPETELMVEEVIKEIEKLKNKEIVLIDVGTGTGCIPISIGKKISNAIIFATDISHRALQVASKNAQTHQKKINFLHGNLLEPFLKQNNNLTTQQFSARGGSASGGNNTNLVITANLPYLTQEQFDSEPSIQKEPKNALVADNQDGLSLYKKLLEQIKLLKYSSLVIFLEIDPSQSSNIKKIINEIFPTAGIEIKNDLAGRDRLVIIRIN